VVVNPSTKEVYVLALVQQPHTIVMRKQKTNGAGRTRSTSWPTTPQDPGELRSDHRFHSSVPVGDSLKDELAPARTRSPPRRSPPMQHAHRRLAREGRSRDGPPSPPALPGSCGSTRRTGLYGPGDAAITLRRLGWGTSTPRVNRPAADSRRLAAGT
jgi:hypothetical protein